MQTNESEAKAMAEKAYSEAVAPAWKAYNEALAAAQKAYDEALASAEKAAEKAYREAVASARKAYDEARAVAEKAYDEARAWRIRHIADELESALHHSESLDPSSNVTFKLRILTSRTSTLATHLESQAITQVARSVERKEI